MIHHVGLCTPVDLNEQTIDFYVAALAPLGYKKAVEFVKTGKVVGLSDGSRTPDFWIMPITHTGDPNLTAGHAHFAFGAKGTSKYSQGGGDAPTNPKNQAEVDLF